MPQRSRGIPAFLNNIYRPNRRKVKIALAHFSKNVQQVIKRESSTFPANKTDLLRKGDKKALERKTEGTIPSPALGLRGGGRRYNQKKIAR